MALVLVTVFALPAFGGACCAGIEAIETASAASSQDDCCPKDATSANGEAPGGESDEDAPCSCPFPCSAGCAGYLGRLLVPTNTLALVEPAPAVAALVGPEFVEPANPDPRDILHVPKRLGV
jgi:hypothetical protein